MFIFSHYVCSSFDSLAFKHLVWTSSQVFRSLHFLIFFYIIKMYMEIQVLTLQLYCKSYICFCHVTVADWLCVILTLCLYFFTFVNTCLMWLLKRLLSWKKKKAEKKERKKPKASPCCVGFLFLFSTSCWVYFSISLHSSF